MTEKNEFQSPERDKNSAAFILATICASPFCVVMVEALINLQKFFDLFVLSVFFLPFLLIATVCGPIFIVLAWIKSPHWCRPFLILYLLAIAAYWMAAAMSSPW